MHHHHPADADVMIVEKALESAKHIETVLVGEDTDLLILLLHHAKPDMKDIYFTTEIKTGSKQKNLEHQRSTRKAWTTHMKVSSLFACIFGM